MFALKIKYTGSTTAQNKNILSACWANNSSKTTNIQGGLSFLTDLTICRELVWQGSSWLVNCFRLNRERLPAPPWNYSGQVAGWRWLELLISSEIGDTYKWQLQYLLLLLWHSFGKSIVDFILPVYEKLNKRRRLKAETTECWWCWKFLFSRCENAFGIVLTMAFCLWNTGMVTFRKFRLKKEFWLVSEYNSQEIRPNSKNQNDAREEKKV